MLHIVLLILKIIGMILGTLLAVLLVGLCVALFVPVRYRIEARRSEAEGAPPIEAEGSVTWLLHFVNIRFQYPADVYLRARLFLFTVFRLPPKQKRKESGRGRNGRKNKKGRGGDRKERRIGSSSVEEGQDAGNAEETRSGENTEGTQGGENPEQTNDGNIKEERMPSEKTISVSEEEKKRSPAEKIKAVLERIRKFFQNIWYTLTGICDKIKTIWENIEYYMDVIRSDTFQKAFSLCREELYSIFSYIRPRKFQADLIIGMDDPAATGKILSYYGILYPFIGGHVNIVPDFDRKRIEGSVLIKGKVRLFTFIKAALRIYFSKDIRKLLSLFKKEDI
ncbi:MAG: DUF2953 domain-containing protein [Lachnospiraceae bacterium]|nr:DUF2953 domain-containing protein [Lachnospiraceae bacterium]